MPFLIEVGPVDDPIAPAAPSLLADYATLFKLRISTMVVITAGAGFYLGCLRSGTSPFRIDGLRVLLGIAVATCGSSALNQALERRNDRLMRRTAERPMATGRISMTHGLSVGLTLTLLGSLFLCWTTNLLIRGPYPAYRHRVRRRLHAPQAHPQDQYLCRGFPRRVTTIDRLDCRARSD